MTLQSPVIPSGARDLVRSLEPCPDEVPRSARDDGRRCCRRLRCSRLRRRRSPPRWATRPSPRPTTTSGRATPSRPSSASSAAPADASGSARTTAQIYGFRYDLRTGSTIQIGLGFARADLQRLIVDPFDSTGQPARLGPGGPDGHVRRGEPPVQPDRRQDLAPAGALRRRRRRPHLSQRHAPATPAGSSSATRSTSRRCAGVRIFVTDRLSLRGEARAAVLEAQVSHDLRGRARARARRSARQLQRRHHRRPTSASGTRAPGCSSGSATPSRSEPMAASLSRSSAFAPCTASSGRTGARPGTGRRSAP